MKVAKKEDLIYCDPPYTFTQSILYGAQSFNLSDLFRTIGQCKERGVFVYDPEANTWGEAPLAVPRGFCKCPSSFYDPVLNAHFIHCAGDSADDGVMWVYRYKKVPPKRGHRE